MASTPSAELQTAVIDMEDSTFVVEGPPPPLVWKVVVPRRRRGHIGACGYLQCRESDPIEMEDAASIKDESQTFLSTH